MAVYLITSVSLEGKIGVQEGGPKHPSTADECGWGWDLTPEHADSQHTFLILTALLKVEACDSFSFLASELQDQDSLSSSTDKDHHNICFPLEFLMYIES